MPLPKDMYYVLIFGRAKEDRIKPNRLEGEFHSFDTKSELNKALTKMQAKCHDHMVLKGQAFIKLPDGRAGIIIKGQRWAIEEKKDVN